VIPHPEEAPDAWTALGHIWMTDCGHLSDDELIEAIEAHRRDPEYGPFTPETCDLLRQAERLQEQRHQLAQAAKHQAYMACYKQRPIAPKARALSYIAQMREAVALARHPTTG